MNFSRRNREIIGYFSFFTFIIFFIILYYQLSTYYPFDPFSPPSGKTTYFMELTYPPISDGKVQELLLDASFNIISNTTIAEGVNMTIANPKVVLYGGTPRNKYIIHNISGVNIGFQNAQPMGSSLKIDIPLSNISQTQYVYHNLPPGASFQMNKNDANIPSFPREPTYELNLSNGYIQWSFHDHLFNFSVAGDYSPSIILEFSNGSSESYTYDEIKLHIPSKSETQSQELNQINGFITIALFIFSLIELWRLISEWIGSKPSIKGEIISVPKDIKTQNKGTKTHKNKP